MTGAPSFTESHGLFFAAGFDLATIERQRPELGVLLAALNVSALAPDARVFGLNSFRVLQIEDLPLRVSQAHGVVVAICWEVGGVGVADRAPYPLVIVEHEPYKALGLGLGVYFDGLGVYLRRVEFVEPLKRRSIRQR